MTTTTPSRRERPRAETVIYLFVAAWTRLYGIVAMEVSGHLRWAMTDVEPLFEPELSRTLGHPAR